MKPETQQYHQARDEDKATSQQQTTTHNCTFYYLFIFRSLVYRANTARRFCHFCSPTLFDLLWFASRGGLRTWERSILGFSIPLQELNCICRRQPFFSMTAGRIWNFLQCKYLTSQQNLDWQWTCKAENSKHVYFIYYVNNDIPFRLRYANNVEK